MTVAQTIPISDIVQMTPGVIGAGGTAGLLSGLVLTQDPSIPPGFLFNAFAPGDAQSWFGQSAPEAVVAANYFPGILNGGQLPQVLLYAAYAETATPAGSYGAPLGALTLAQLKALAGTLIVTAGGEQFTSEAISLTAATSFQNAAELMTAGFTEPPFAVAYDAQRNRFTLLTTLAGPTANSTDVSGTLAAGVGLSQAAGAFIATVGSAPDTPTSAMNRAITLSVNWALFTTAWEPELSDRLLFSAWTSAQNFAFGYVGWDADAADLTPNNAASFGAQVMARPYQGTLPTYGGPDTAGAFMGYAASINYNVTNGRTTLAFRQFNAGTAPTCTTLANAKALRSNGYSYVGAYANSANTYTIAYNGQVSGAFLWLDTFINQIWLNRSLQQAEFETMLAYNSLPYNSDGYDALYMGGVTIIDQAVNAGVIRANVQLSPSQAMQVDQQAGRIISDVLQTRGWYLLVGPTGNVAQTEGERASPTFILWYSDGGSIQQLNVQSLAIV